MPTDYPGMTPDPLGVLALAALLTGTAAGLLARVCWIKAGGWLLAIAGLSSSAQLVRGGEDAMAAGVFCVLGVVAALLVWADMRRPAARQEEGEPGSPDSIRDPRPNEVPDGAADDVTHDRRWDEESPRLRMPGKVRRPE